MRCYVLGRSKMTSGLQICVNFAAWQGHGGQGSPMQAAAVMYGASPSWPLAHLPNAAAHGPASTALGDSWKAHHHSASHHPARPAKLLLAGESTPSERVHTLLLLFSRCHACANFTYQMHRDLHRLGLLCC